MPQIMPPIYWLRAVRVFMMRPAGEGADHARHADFARPCVDAHLDEFGAERIHQLLALGAAAERRRAARRAS